MTGGGCSSTVVVNPFSSMYDDVMVVVEGIQTRVVAAAILTKRCHQICSVFQILPTVPLSLARPKRGYYSSPLRHGFI